MISFNHQVFMEVARLLSFTKASESLFISQPAVSRHIQQLEKHYNTSLFDRKGVAISLTPAGKILQQHLQSALIISRQIEMDIAQKDHRVLKGELRLGTSTTVALYIIPSVLSGFHKRNAEVEISLLNRNSENVLIALQEHAIDLGIVEGKNKMTGVNSQYFITDEVVAVCTPHSPLATDIPYKISSLLEMPVALRERGSGTLVAITSALQKQGIKITDLNISMRLGGTEALKNFIMADGCLGLLPMRSVAKELATGELVRIFFEDLTMVRQFYFVQRHGEESNPMNAAFIKFAKQHYNIKL